MQYKTDSEWKKFHEESAAIIAAYAAKGVVAHESIGKHNGFYVSSVYVPRAKAKKELKIK